MHPPLRQQNLIRNKSLLTCVAYRGRRLFSVCFSSLHVARSPASEASPEKSTRNQTAQLLRATVALQAPQGSAAQRFNRSHRGGALDTLQASRLAREVACTTRPSCYRRSSARTPARRTGTPQDQCSRQLSASCGPLLRREREARVSISTGCVVASRPRSSFQTCSMGFRSREHFAKFSRRRIPTLRMAARGSGVHNALS